MKKLSRLPHSLAAVHSALIIAMLTSFPSSANPSAVLNILTWGDYIDQELVTEFEENYNASINFIIFESDSARDEMVITSGIESYDIILVDSVSIPSYIKMNWISPFDHQDAPNLSYVALPDWLQAQKSLTDTCTEYAWGTTGIAYRQDLVNTPITHWQQIFDPTPELHKKILMSSSSEEVIGMALKTLGYPMYSSDKQQLEEARQLLLAQSPNVAGYSHIAADADGSKLITGEVSVVLTYSGDALMLKDIDPNVEYVLPAEGGAIWVDYLCLSAQSNNQQLAHQFVNFINQPKQAAKNAQYFYSATPNREAEKLLPDEFLNDPIIYPNPGSLANSELYKAMPSRTVKKRLSIMKELASKLEDN